MKEWKLIYINSFMRSGSTLLGTLIAESEGIRYLGELRNLEKFIANRIVCACGGSPDTCPYWSRVFNSVAPEVTQKMITAGSQGMSHYLLKALALLPTGRGVGFHVSSFLNQSDASSVQNIGKVLDNAFNVESVNYFCDSSHRNLQAALMYQAHPNKVKIIRLVRDGRDVCCSVRRRQGDPIWRSAIRWRRFNEYSDRLLRRLPPEASIRVKYEDLCINKDDELSRIGEFLDTQSPTSAHLTRLSGDHHIGGSPGVQLGTQPVASNVGQWRGEFNQRDEKQFRLLAGRYNNSLGYP